MGIIGRRVESQGFRSIEDIKNYGELLEEIEKNKKAIENVKKGPFYEFGDEFDLQLRLNRLNRIRLKHEKKWRMEQELGIYTCPECNSGKLDVTCYEDRALFTTFFEAECCSCGYKWVNKFNHYEYREIFDKVESEFPDELIHGRI